MGYLPAILLGLFVLTIITVPFAVLIHELGHAFFLLFSGSKGATIFIGSYGDEKYSFKISISRLDIWIRYNPLKWRGGLCSAKAESLSLTGKFLFILGGPLFSLLFALLQFGYLYFYGVQNAVDFICAFAILVNAFAFVVNLFPFKTELANGEVIFSDGYWLFNLKTLTRGIEAFREACKLFDNEDYGKAANLFTKSISAGYKTESSYRLTYLTYILLQDYLDALHFLQKLESRYSLDANDYYYYGFLGFVTETEIDSDTCFQKALKLNPNHTDALNATGYRLIEKNAFQEALPYFEKVIQIDPKYSYAYNNRGYLKLETGLLEEGLADVLHSIALNDQNAYAYRNQGIYHLKKNDSERALQLFEQAKQMDDSTQLIEALIEQAAMEKGRRAGL